MIKDWVALNMTPGIGPRAAAKLLERFGAAEAVYGATRAELEKLRLLPEAIDSIIARDRFETCCATRRRAETRLYAQASPAFRQR
jgi:ERCC4-type nuclease